MASLVPCAVVVDSRNVRGQSAKVFGWPRQVSVPGIRDAMRAYGFEPVEIYIGVATRAASNTPSDQVASSLRMNLAFRDEVVADGAAVLEGYLAERGRPARMEEKQVDVLCAVQVCDLADRILTKVSEAKCIVVLSEDMDLMPAYDFARRRGVPAYAAAYDTVHQRDDQREWLLLGEPAMTALVQAKGGQVGAALRTKLAGIATATAKPKAHRWTVHAPSGTRGQYLMRSGLGAAGLWSPGRRVDRLGKADLFPVGMTIHPEAGGRFPHIVLAEEPLDGPMPDVETAEVLYWQSPTSVKVAVSDSTASLRVTPGTLLPGQVVAVLRRAAGLDRATYLIGALSDYPKVDGWSSPTSIARATITGPQRGAWIPAQIDETGDNIHVHAEHLEHVTSSTQVMVFLSGLLESYARPMAMPLSCCLPTS